MTDLDDRSETKFEIPIDIDNKTRNKLVKELGNEIMSRVEFYQY